MIIGLGYAARSGKDTTAAYLCEKYGFIQEAFATPLKEYMGRDICGLTEKHLHGLWKEIVVPDYGMTARELLQKMGDSMRVAVHSDFWIINMKRRIKTHKKNGDDLIVISDVRYINEAKMIKDLGGIMIRTNRENADKITNPEHISENEMKNYTEWDHYLDNNGSYQGLYTQIDTIMNAKLYHKLGKNE